MHLTAELGRDMFALKSLDFSTTPDAGALTHLTATALVQHFAKPEWQASVTGNVDVKQLGYLADVEGLNGGNAGAEGERAQLLGDAAGGAEESALLAEA